MIAQLEQARAFDAPSISAILSAWIDETEWMPRIHTPDEYRGFGAWLIAQTDVTVARVQGEVAGFLARRQAKIHSLYVTHDLRGQGIGARLLNQAQANQPHLELWTFQANTAARAFYALNGFVEDELTDGHGNDEKLPDVHMIWAKES